MADDECGNALACLQVQWPLPHRVLPFPCLPGPALPGPAFPCPALPCPALPTPALPCPALPCPLLPCPALPFLALPCPPLRCPDMSWYLASCHATSSWRSRAHQGKNRQDMQNRAWLCLVVLCCVMSSLHGNKLSITLTLSFVRNKCLLGTSLWPVEALH